MRKTLIGLLLFVAAQAAGASTLRETVDQTFDVKSGASLSLDNVNGRVTITGWDQPRIRVMAEKVIERADQFEAKELMSKLRVDMHATDNGVVIRTQMPKRHDGFLDFMFGGGGNASVHYEISVPRSSNLDVDNTNGALLITGVQGSLKLETTNGHIEMTRCAGSVDVSTTNGRITAELLSLDSRASNRFETTNGRIELTVPSDLKADVDAATTNGSIDTDLPVTTRTIGRSMLRGTMNGGGGSLRIHTTNGSIRIRGGSSAAQISSR